MAQLIITAFVSLDGVMEAPGGEPGHRSSGWTFTSVDPDPAAYALKAREQEEASALLLGRHTYQMFAPVWPTHEEFDRYNTLPRYVVSTTLEQADPAWPATVLHSLEEVAALREQPADGPILVHGSAELGWSLAQAGLVDGYNLMVFPVLLGAGKRLFPQRDAEMTRLVLREHEVFPNGIQVQVFDVLRSTS